MDFFCKFHSVEFIQLDENYKKTRLHNAFYRREERKVTGLASHLIRYLRHHQLEANHLYRIKLQMWFNFQR